MVWKKNAILHRLYEDQLTSGKFDDAEKILWTVHSKKESEDLLLCEVMSSGYWLDPLKDVDQYETTAYLDEV